MILVQNSVYQVISETLSVKDVLTRIHAGEAHGLTEWITQSNTDPAPHPVPYPSDTTNVPQQLSATKLSGRSHSAECFIPERSCVHVRMQLRRVKTSPCIRLERGKKLLVVRVKPREKKPTDDLAGGAATSQAVE